MVYNIKTPEKCYLNAVDFEVNWLKINGAI